jgi:F-type H+-transporting ATPase subunit delta
MTSAAIDDDARRESLKRIFAGKVNALLLNFLLVLNSKGRTWLLPEVCQVFHRQVDAQRGRRRAFVTTAVALDDAQRARLRDEARRMCGLEPVLVERIDPAIIGGAVLQVGDRVLDTSLRRRLQSIRRQLRDRFDRHLHQGAGRFITEA